MASLEPHSYPLGTAFPPTDSHAISVSLPTWNNVVEYMQGNKDVAAKLQCDYPRFYEHKYVQQLSAAVLDRVRAPTYMRCAIFPSNAGMKRCSHYLRDNAKIGCQVQELSFTSAQQTSVESSSWTRFSVVLYLEEHANHIRELWAFMGDGISSRHAKFCLERFAFMASASLFPALQTCATSNDERPLSIQPWTQCDAEAKEAIKSRIAVFVASEKHGLKAPQARDVLLYPKGMCAIGTVARSLVPASRVSSEAVIFGWPYGSTPRAVRESGYDRFTFHSQGTSEELDQLESSLSSGRLIASLFCEIPSNPLCATPDLSRIRRLADQYHFAVICDDTIGTFVNVDVLPYADAIVTSLTKMFSGACNVMGGSVTLNPQSPFYEQLFTKLSGEYEDLIFPVDAEVLLQNCLDFSDRVQKANKTAFAVVNFLQSQPLIAHVNYPTTVATKALYEAYRRTNGGYGYLLSMVFKSPQHAIMFYDAIEVRKGPSCGTNFTLVLPYSQVSHAFELDWAEERGLSKHIVRISVGLEDEGALISKLDAALQSIETKAARPEHPNGSLGSHYH